MRIKLYIRQNLTNAIDACADNYYTHYKKTWLGIEAIQLVLYVHVFDVHVCTRTINSLHNHGDNSYCL